MTDEGGEGTDGAPRGAGENGGASLDEASRNSIEGRLRNMFDEFAREPVPDRFVELLDRLERSEREGS